MGKTTKAMKSCTVYTNNCIGSFYNLVSRSSLKDKFSHSTNAFYYKLQTKAWMCANNSEGHMLASPDERIHFKKLAGMLWCIFR